MIVCIYRHIRAPLYPIRDSASKHARSHRHWLIDNSLRKFVQMNLLSFKISVFIISVWVLDRLWWYMEMRIRRIDSRCRCIISASLFQFTIIGPTAVDRTVLYCTIFLKQGIFLNWSSDYSMWIILSICCRFSKHFFSFFFSSDWTDVEVGIKNLSLPNGGKFFEISFALSANDQNFPASQACGYRTGCANFSNTDDFLNMETVLVASYGSPASALVSYFLPGQVRWRHHQSIPLPRWWRHHDSSALLFRLVPELVIPIRVTLDCITFSIPIHFSLWARCFTRRIAICGIK